MKTTERMRLGISPWVWAELIGTNDLGLVEKAHGLGFEGLELFVQKREPFDVVAMRAALKQAGLTPIISTTLTEDRDLIHANADYHKNGQTFLRYCVDLAVELGADRIIGPIVSAPGNKHLADPAQCQREFDLAVKNLRPVANYAADHGVRLAAEVMNRFEVSFLNTVDEGLRLVEAVGSPAFGLLLDTFHMNIEEKSAPAAIERAGRHVFHLHVIENDRGTPGSGSVDWFGVFDALRRIDYRGWVVIEGFSTKLDWLSLAVCHWRPLAADMTTLAREGRAFLQSMMQVRGEA